MIWCARHNKGNGPFFLLWTRKWVMFHECACIFIDSHASSSTINLIPKINNILLIFYLPPLISLFNARFWPLGKRWNRFKESVWNKTQQRERERKERDSDVHIGTLRERERVRELIQWEKDKTGKEGIHALLCERLDLCFLWIKLFFVLFIVAVCVFR